MEQGAVFVRNLFRRAHEDTARTIHQLGLKAHRDQPQDLILQHLAVTGAILVPDHQVHRQSFQTPVGMRLNQLPHQFDIGKVADAQQHDRQVA